MGRDVNKPFTRPRPGLVGSPLHPGERRRRGHREEKGRPAGLDRTTGERRRDSDYPRSHKPRWRLRPNKGWTRRHGRRPAQRLPSRCYQIRYQIDNSVFHTHKKYETGGRAAAASGVRRGLNAH
jgi:hypothetical protein